MRLSNHDLELVSEGLRELYAVTELERMPHAITAMLARFLPAESISYNEFEADSRKVLSIIEPELTRFHECLPVFAAHLHEHPVVNHFEQTRALLPFKISDFLTNREFRQTGLYNEFYRQFDVEYQLGFFLAGSRQHQICMAINRKRKDFSERDRQMIKLLRPHLTQALANTSAAAALQMTAGCLNAAVESSEQGVAWVDRRGKVLFVTNRAQRWIAEYFRPISPRAFLPDELQSWVKMHLKGAGVLREPLSVNRGDHALQVRMVEKGAHVLLIFTQAQRTLKTSRFAVYGLTPRESEVLGWVCEGKSNPEIATILGRSPRTIDKHVERILEKLRVETRRAAMLWAWENAAG